MDGLCSICGKQLIGKEDDICTGCLRDIKKEDKLRIKIKSQEKRENTKFRK